MRSFYKDFFFNRAAYGCYASLFIQQLIIASSTLWLTLLIDAIDTSHNFTLYLILYLFSLVAPYFPEAISMVFNNIWKQNAFSLFIQKFIEVRKNDPIAWNDQTLKDETVTILTSEGQNTLHATIEHVYWVVFYFLNVALNIIAISLLIESRFAVGYFISFVFVFILMKLQYKKQAHLAKEAQDARIHLGQSLLSSWDNVLLGNRYNFNLWLRNTAACIQKATDLNLSSALFNQIMTIVISLLIFGPTIIVSVVTVLEHRNEPLALTTLMLTLPRLYLVLGYTQMVLSYCNQWTTHKVKLNTIENILKPVDVPSEALEERISWSKLSFDPPLPFPVKNLLTYEMKENELTTNLSGTSYYPCGRYTLRGEYGSGKSTFLMVVKKQLKEHAFYLPNNHQLAFLSNGTKTTTRELLKQQLKEIQDNFDVKVLLLDEWDVNLDDTSSRELSQLIDELSDQRCVIEVRHRY